MANHDRAAKCLQTLSRHDTVRTGDQNIWDKIDTIL